MTKGEPKDSRFPFLFPLDSKIMKEASELRAHPEECDIRHDLFTAAITAQKNTVGFLQKVTGVDAKDLLHQFPQWEKDRKKTPLEVRKAVVAYFQKIEGTAASSGDRRGALAVHDENNDYSYAIVDPLVQIFFMGVKNGYGGHVTQTPSGLAVTSSTASIAKNYLDEFMRDVVKDSQKPDAEKQFRAALARALFLDIHDNLIFPANKQVRDLEDMLHHKEGPIDYNTSEVREVKTAREEMERILLKLPFPVYAEFRATSHRLLNISPEFIQFFRSLGWDGSLKQMVAQPYAMKLGQISQRITPSLN